MKLTKKKQIELIEIAIRKNEKYLKSMKNYESIESLQMNANLEGKITAFNDVLEMLKGNTVYMNIEAGI